MSEQEAMGAARAQATRAKNTLYDALQAAVTANDNAIIESLTAKYMKAVKLEVEARKREISAVLNADPAANLESLKDATEKLKKEIARQKAGENRLNAIGAGVNLLLGFVLLFGL